MKSRVIIRIKVTKTSFQRLTQKGKVSLLVKNCTSKVCTGNTKANKIKLSFITLFIVINLTQKKFLVKKIEDFSSKLN